MNNLTRTPVLWALFVANILVGFGFGVFQTSVGGTYLDTISQPELAQSVLASLTPEEAATHFWVTVTLDTLFPLTYGGLFAGLVLRFFRRWQTIACVPAVLAGVTDLTENMVRGAGAVGRRECARRESLVDAAEVWVVPGRRCIGFRRAGNRDL